MTDEWRREAKRVISLLKENDGTLPIEYGKEFIERQAAIVRPWLEDVVRAGVVDGRDILPTKAKPVAQVDWELVNTGAADWAKRYTYDLVRGITDTTKRRLQDALHEWVSAGETFPGLVKRVNAIYDDRTRAKLIAATEATRAYAEANTRAWQAAGAHGREWRTAVDELVCPICGPLHLERAAMGDVFPGGYANPPAHPNCRCSLVPVIEPERVGHPVGHPIGVGDEFVTRQPTPINETWNVPQIVDYFNERYEVYVDVSPGNSIKPQEAALIDRVMGLLSPRFVKENKLFSELVLSDTANQLHKNALGVHFGSRITIFPDGRVLDLPGEFSNNGVRLSETLLHEIGESTWKQLPANDRKAWGEVSREFGQFGLSPSESFAVYFSKWWVKDLDIPPELETLGAGLWQ